MQDSDIQDAFKRVQDRSRGVDDEIRRAAQNIDWNLSGMAEVLAVLAPHKMTQLAIGDYLTSESDELEGLRPLDLLRAGRVAEAVAHAGRYGKMGA
jgi:hypothetical protein